MIIRNVQLRPISSSRRNYSSQEGPLRNCSHDNLKLNSLRKIRIRQEAFIYFLERAVLSCKEVLHLLKGRGEGKWNHYFPDTEQEMASNAALTS